MKNIAPLVAALLLSACGGSSDSNDFDNDTANIDTSQTITATGATLSINNTGDTVLNIVGSENTITIESKLSELHISGRNNLLIFVGSTSIDTCTITGKDNSSEDSTGTPTSLGCAVTGTGNTGF
ncbi:DUF3060 domain-containing protein [Teredinibacter turnerae]|uniref:DUF3060 domain-containing protein n=1 Tax=Teredinibacter turnerae TaxID=2426 RepID=UPI0005F777B4|nr:DUF3060 domain-containing protein [Teredinibacter turnerae]